MKARNELEALTVAALLAMAAEMGLSLAKRAKKSEIIDAIEAAQVSQPSEEVVEEMKEEQVEIVEQAPVVEESVVAEEASVEQPGEEVVEPVVVEEVIPYEAHLCPVCRGNRLAEMSAEDSKADRVCTDCGTEFVFETGEVEFKGELPQPEQPKQKGHTEESREKARASIAASWTNNEVRAARAKRHTVTVEGVEGEFKSVREAFRKLGLPDSKHIPFRLKLKASGKETFTFGKLSYTFIAHEVVKEGIARETVYPEQAVEGDDKTMDLLELVAEPTKVSLEK